MQKIVEQLTLLLEENKTNTYQLQELLATYNYTPETTDNDYYNNTSQKISSEVTNIKNKINNLIISYESINKSIGLIEALNKVLEAMGEEEKEEAPMPKPMNRTYNPHKVVIPPRERPIEELSSVKEPENLIASPTAPSMVDQMPSVPSDIMISGERLVKKKTTAKPRVVMSLESTYIKYYNSEKRKQRLVTELLKYGHANKPNSFNLNQFEI